MHPLLHVLPEVAEALAAGRPVVALESTVIAHGLPRPDNLAMARDMQAAVRAHGAVPATLALMDGRIRVGLSDAELERLATAREVRKVSRRDLAAVLARGELGATTVAGTLACAALAGIRLFATGGLGGVHRGGELSLDVSADLPELARSPLGVVCAGAKSVLDLPRTLEVLESLGVPVVGYGTGHFPAFFCQDSGLALPHRVDGPREAARMLAAHFAICPGGVVLAQPPPAGACLPATEVEALVAEAEVEARHQGVSGPALTPFLLARLVARSGGRTLAVNQALLLANAAAAADIAVALAAGS
ncbi:MAG TPA: pseudouridine-5'-phosphate glycosidase [Myxococcota bacterium]|nr:pseudouridine-5'-phosphate glycosidase [Myxococcota bacterium]HRY95976.1 pseudouridine-5'-phosphate glycosidase [Myxococcota bacterium]HSA22616.1 pseudouridine-5'-phosphate glycosidase [Myxococcota bacterium]